MIRRVLETFLFMGLGVSLALFLYNGLINPHLSYDEAGQFWLGKGLNHFSKLNAEYGTLSDVLKENRTFNLDPGGFSVIAFIWLKISHVVYWVRLLPLIFTGFSLYFFYKILQLLDLRINEALLICLYFFISKSLVEFSFTFRAYSMEMAGTLMSLYIVLKNKSNPISTSNLIRLSIVFNIFIWSRYGFIINILAINVVLFFLVIKNRQFSIRFLIRYGYFILIPLLITFIAIYFTELSFHFHAGPVPWYQKNLTLQHQTFYEMAKNNFFSRRGLPFFLLILMCLVNYKFPFVRLSKEIKLIVSWMLLTHLFSITFSIFGIYPWYIKGRWGLVLEFISLLSAIIVLVELIRLIEDKYCQIHKYIVGLLLISLILLFNLRAFNYYTPAISFLNKFERSGKENCIINWWLTPEVKYQICQSKYFAKLSKKRLIQFEGIDNIPQYPKTRTWFLISNPDTSITRIQFENFKFKYKFIVNTPKNRIIEIL